MAETENTPDLGTIVIGARPNPVPTSELAEEQKKGLINDFLAAAADAREAAALGRMFPDAGARIPAVLRAIRRAQDAADALREAGITQDQFTAYEAWQRTTLPTLAPQNPPSQPPES